MNPQLQIGLSADLVTRLLRTLVPLLVPCPDAAHLTADQSLITDITITEAVFFRSDETALQDLNGTGARDTLAALAGLLPALELDGEGPYPGVDARPGVGHPFLLPRTFLLVSGSFRLITVSQLSADHSSDGGQLYVFDRQAAQPYPQMGEPLPPLLFSVDPRTSVGLKGPRLHIEYVSIFDSAITQHHITRPGQPDLPFGAVNVVLQTAIQPQDIDIPLDSLVKSAPLAGVRRWEFGVNVGITTGPWTPPAGSEQPRPLKGGLRIGLDLTLPPSIDEWRGFYQLDPLHPPLLDRVADLSQDLAVAIDGPFFTETLKLLIDLWSSSIVINEVLQWRAGGSEVSLMPGLIQAVVPIVSGDLHPGDLVFDVAPSVESRPDVITGLPGAFLAIQACLKFDVSLGTEIIGWLLFNFISGGGIDPVFPGLVTGSAQAILGAINALAHDVVNPYAGSLLAGLTLPPGLLCDPEQQNCRACRMLAEFSLGAFGQLILTEFGVQADGIGIAFAVQPKGALRPAKLAVGVGSWDYPHKFCHPSPPDPTMRVLVENVGGLPLRVCLVDQDDQSATIPRVLTFSPSIGVGPGSPDRFIEPGGMLPIDVTAAVTGNSSYDQLHPPSLWMRVLSSGGMAEVDLNNPAPALTQNPARAAGVNALSNYLCNVMRTLIDLQQLRPDPEVSPLSASLWKAIAFTDPLRFTTTDLVVERVDLAFDASPQTSLTGFDGQGRPLAIALEHNRRIEARLTSERAPAADHTQPAISFAASSPPGLPSAAARRSGRQGKSQAQPFELQRWLYHRRGVIELGVPIIGLAKVEDGIVVLTSSSLRLARVTAGRLGPWTQEPANGPISMDAQGRLVAVASQSGVAIYSHRLLVLDAVDEAATSVAVQGERVWMARADEVAVVRRRNQKWTVSSQLPVQVDQLAIGGRTVFGLDARKRILVLGRSVTDTGIRASHITRFGSQVAAMVDDSVVLLDSNAQVRARYAAPPFLLHGAEVPGGAIDVQNNSGTLTLYDRYETTPLLQ